MTPRSTEERRLAEKAITLDLLGPGALTEPAEIEVPEKYELRRCLGRGGFGVVHLAHDRILDRNVALKFLLDARPADVERLRREARTTARLDDPAIVQVYEFGETRGQPYIAMQFIDGPQLLEAELDFEAIARCFLELARALQHAHEAGIVHRDIKPANILVDSAGRPHLTDFGIARDLFGSSGATLSQAGFIIGTPELMAPEQARGEPHEVDARSDVYSFGATLFQRLTRRLPFQGSSAVEILHAVIHDDPPLPRSIDHAVPRTLEAVTLRCMQKEKRRRYGSMKDVAADLEQFLDGTAVVTESAAWFRRLVGAPTAPAAPAETEPHWSRALEMARELAAWDSNLYRVTRNLPRTYPQLDAIIEQTETILASHPDVAWARFYRGAARFRRGQLGAAVDDMERSIDRMSQQASAHFEMGQVYLALYLAERHSAHQHIDREGTRWQLQESRGRLTQALIAFQEAQLHREGLPLWQVEYAGAVERLADDDSAGCVAICDQLLEEDPDVDALWRLRGDALRLAGDDPIPSYERALEVRRSDHGTLLAKAEVERERGDVDAARHSLERALEILPGFVDAIALLARLELTRALELLAGAAAEGDAAAFIERGTARVAEGLALEPDHYELNVTAAELHVAGARHGGERQHFDDALDILERARSLDGCGNRVLLLEARTRLERARSSFDDPAAARRDLEAILAHRDASSDRVRSAGWPDLLGQAEAELRALDD